MRPAALQEGSVLLTRPPGQVRTTGLAPNKHPTSSHSLHRGPQKANVLLSFNNLLLTIASFFQV